MHYKKNISFMLIFCFTFLLQAGALAQATFEGLGHLPGEPGNDVWSSAYGVSSDGLAVVGWSDDDVITKAFRWTILGGMLDLGGLPGGSEDSHARAASEDGSVVVGWSGSEKGQEAFRWTAGGMVGLGDLPGGNFDSDAYDVSSDGLVVVGQSSSANGTAEAFRWTASGGMVGLGDLPGGIFQSFAEGVSADGSVVVGTSWIENGTEAFRWTELGGMIGLGGLVGGSGFSRAYDVTPDGSIVVGSASGPNGLELFRWTSAGGMEGLGGSVGPGPYAVSADGSVIVGRLSGSDMVFIYTDADGIRNLKEVLENDYGLDLTDWALEDARGISDDGTVIVGTAAHPNGIKEAWRAVLGGSAITVVSPSAGELVIAGTVHDILWASNSSIDFVHIEFSDDEGATYNFVATFVPADSNHYEWTVPSALSTKCKIKISDANNPLTFDESETFKVKGYELTRINPDGNYEAFKPNVHGWSFANTTANMWPSSWWSQFNYQSGIDPFTGSTYSQWDHTFVSAFPQHFPDWPLFVRVFGVQQSYWNTFLGIYKNKAKLKWVGIKEDYRGSCTGFSISSLLAFDDKQAFISSFPEMPAFNNLYSLAIDDSVRKVVNQLFVHWYSAEHLAYHNQQKGKTPRETLQDIKDMLISEIQDDQYVVIKHLTLSKGHAVSPYKVIKLSSSPAIYSVFVYDSNHPGDSTKQIIVDSSANSWSYPILQGFNGTSKFYLMDPVSNYLVSPTLSGATSELIPAESGQDHIQIYNTTEASILITDQGGNAIGFEDSVTFNDLPDGVSIIPITSRYNPPIGYYVPAGEYSVSMEKFTDSLTYFSVFSDSLVFSYRRSGALFNQTDELRYGDGFSIHNPDNQAKKFTLAAVVIEDSFERVFHIVDPEVFQNDSMHFYVLDRSNLKMVSIGSNTTYDLRIELASATENPRFENVNISLESNSSHQIVPDWSDLQNQPVQILIDLGNDGTIDDTLTIKNQITSIDDQGLLGIPDEYNLAQNYPNPFNPVTKIRYSLPQQSNVSLIVYNILGQEVITLVNEQQPAGNYEVSFDATTLSSGIYLYKIQAGDYTDVKKMILLR